MKACPSCEQQNPDEAQFCSQCGTALGEEPLSPKPPPIFNEKELWQALIGPNKSIQFSWGEGWSWRPAGEYYLGIFKRFHSNFSPRFALTWLWPAFLFDPFLWFLYRKMYMYALVYAIGPVVSAFLTGDFTVGIVWRLMAGATGNYIYFWHLKDQLQRISSRSGLDPMAQTRLLGQEGGVQPYVLWLGIALHLLMIGVLIAAMGEGPPEETQFPETEPAGDQKFL